MDEENKDHLLILEAKEFCIQAGPHAMAYSLYGRPPKRTQTLQTKGER